MGIYHSIITMIIKISYLLISCGIEPLFSFNEIREKVQISCRNFKGRAQFFKCCKTPGHLRLDTSAHNVMDMDVLMDAKLLSSIEFDCII